MEASKTTGERMEAARELEKAGRLSDAAAIYQKLFNNDRSAQPVMERLLVVYRKLKDYPKELSVLNDAIAAFQQRQKAVREKWISSHPQAASAGRSMLRQLEKGGNAAMSLGDDPIVGRWMKRKELVARRISGKKGKIKKPDLKGVAAAKKKEVVGAKKKEVVGVKKKETVVARKKETVFAKKKAAVDARKKAAAEDKQRLALQKREEKERKAAEALRNKAEQEQRKAEAARQKAEADRKKSEEKSERERHPSLFIITLQYLVSLERIDAVMKQHVAYLKKHYENHDFLVSGRMVPRIGGIILARGKDRAGVERIIKQDPFVKRKLASADIIEFTASQSGKGLEGWLKAFR